MFGPDICGNDKKTHAILNYKDKNHLIKKPIQCESDQMTHLYTFIIKPDQTYKVLVDQEEKSSGSILKNWELLPVEKIDDPNASKPSSWVDNPMMDDPTDVKPDGWDAPDTITDPEALKPEDWDDEDDGEWEPAVLPNPDYKGEWKPKQIKNPDYKGKWVHPKIDNPAYNYDANIYAYKSQYVGFDLWQVKAGTMFDNIIITDSLEEANQFASLTFTKDKPLEKKAKEALDKEEEERIEKERLENEIKREKESKDTSKDDITVVPPIEQEIKDEEHGEL
ncbi:Calreticulin family-domain-containing protein [Globomyces pollinis-pini]|nr:Calreticulin family-domain-containing protein [Globomyces pollinis-pini]